MTYKKKRGVLHCVIVGYTPLWLDVMNAKTGGECTVYLATKMSEKMKVSVEKDIATASHKHLLVEKMEDAQHYKFKGFSQGQHMGRQKMMEKKIAYEALEREINADYNLVRSRSNRQSLVLGRAGLPTGERTGGKIDRVLNNRIDNSKAHAEEKRQREVDKAAKDKKKFLVKLRKKYFYDRELMPLVSDYEWDEYLLSTYGEGVNPPAKTDTKFEEKLKEAGLL